MDFILLIFKKDYENELISFFKETCPCEYEQFNDITILPDGEYHEYMDDFSYEVSKRSSQLINELGELSMWKLYILKDRALEDLLGFLENLFVKFHGYAMDCGSEHLWTWDEIKDGKIVNRYSFFHTYSLKYLSGPYHRFDILGLESFNYEKIDFKKLIRIPDNMISDLYDSMMGVDTFTQSFDRPSKALDICGITLIPPESMDKFINIIKRKTHPNFLKEHRVQIEALISLLQKARDENKYVIHYGI